MNVYDFDQTIFYPDSSASFIQFCFSKYPRLFLRKAPKIAKLFADYEKTKTDASALKEELFSFLEFLDEGEVNQLVEDFWIRYKKNIQGWYLAQKRPDDVIISASPEFLLTPLAEELGVALIATPMNPRSGRIQGCNCHDEEKCRRFLKLYPHARVENFYSDSLSDTPMAKLAEHAFLVKKDQLTPWLV